MRTYRVYFHYTHGGYYDLEAEDAEQAEAIAEGRFIDEQEPSYHFLGAGGFEVTDIEDCPQT